VAALKTLLLIAWLAWHIFLEKSRQRNRLLYLLFCWIALDHMRASIPKLIGIFKPTVTSNQKRSELLVCCSIF
jgi:hypothetical protein